MLLSITNADDNRVPASMWLKIRYVEEEDSVPVERQISQQITTPCRGHALRTGVVKKIHTVEVLLSFDDAYEHDYVWESPAVEDGLMLIVMQKGDHRPQVSLNGVNASDYHLGVSTSTRCWSTACCLCCLPVQCFCCCRDKYAYRDEYEVMYVHTPV